MSARTAVDASSVSLHQLEGFLEVARTLNFRRAAETLYLTQPSLSRQIRTLEVRLGVALFNRTTRSVSLTPQGQRLIPLAAELIADVRAGVALAREAEEGVRTIRVYHCAEASAQATRIGGLLRDRRPTTEVQQHESTAAELFRLSGERGKEIRIIAGPGGRCDSVAVATDPVVAVVPEGSRFAVPGMLGLEPLAKAELCALGSADAPALRAVLERADIHAEAVENGAEIRALSSGRILLDLASRWEKSDRVRLDPQQRLLRRPLPAIDQVTFMAATRSGVLDAMLREILAPGSVDTQGR